MSFVTKTTYVYTEKRCIKTVLHFQVAKSRVLLSWITSIFIKFMSPRDHVGEIKGEILHHINVWYQGTHSFQTQLFSIFVSELTIWSCINVFVSALVDLNYMYILGQKKKEEIWKSLKSEPLPHQNYVYVFILHVELNNIMGQFSTLKVDPHLIHAIHILYFYTTCTCGAKLYMRSFSVFIFYPASSKLSLHFITTRWAKLHISSFSRLKRSVMITQEMCPIRAELSTHKHLGKCIYLLFVSLAVIGFRQNYFYILPKFWRFWGKSVIISLFNKQKTK